MVALRSFVTVDRVSADALRKSAEKVNRPAALVRFPAERLPGNVEDFDLAVARLFECAFPGPSRNAQAEAASRRLGISPDTATRILARETVRISASVVFAALLVFQERHGRAFEFGAGLVVLVAQVGGEG